MSSTQTSRDAYCSIREKLGSRQLKVLEVIEKHPGGITNNEICHELHWPVNTVTPRCFELRTADLVAQFGERPDRFTGRRSKVWVRKSGIQLEFGGFFDEQENSSGKKGEYLQTTRSHEEKLG